MEEIKQIRKFGALEFTRAAAKRSPGKINGGAWIIKPRRWLMLVVLVRT